MITRKEWARKQSRCWICGRTQYLEIHEMWGGPIRFKTKLAPCMWICACDQCHRRDFGLHDDRFWPKAKQLALKKLCDPDHYDLEAALNLVRVPDHTKGKAVIVTPEDVEVWVEELRNKIYTRQPLTEVEL